MNCLAQAARDVLHASRVLAVLVALCAACGDEEEPPAPAFPSDYATSYVEVRDCRRSGDHELSWVRVLADPTSADAYQSRDRGFPEGAVLLKAEYEFSDPTCEGEILRWTVMAQRAAASSPDTLGWYWQDVDARRNVVSENDSRCVGCHTGCGVPPDGYLGTCTVGASYAEREAP